MKKLNGKSLIKLIENLVNRFMESKVEELVEERVMKITPMLVEHEVNRLLREQSAQPKQSSQPQQSSYMNEGTSAQPEVNREDMRSRFKRMIGESMDEPLTSTAQSPQFSSKKPVDSNYELPQTGPDGQRIDYQNEAVQNVASLMNKDFSKALGDLPSMKNKKK